MPYQKVSITSFLEREVIVKERFSKKYRHEVLDKKLTRSRVAQVFVRSYFVNFRRRFSRRSAAPFSACQSLVSACQRYILLIWSNPSSTWSISEERQSSSSSGMSHHKLVRLLSSFVFAFLILFIIIEQKRKQWQQRLDAHWV